MRLVTQDGQAFDFPAGTQARFYAVLPAFPKSANCVKAYVGNDFRATVGYYATKTGATTAAEMLNKAQHSGATELTAPQDTFAKAQWELLDDLAEEHGLTLVSINELGYTPTDTARNRRIWRTTDEFERRNIIVADEYGSYETSLAKWRTLQRESA